MYFPIHNVPETFVDVEADFTKYIDNFIGNYYYYVYHYIPEFLYIHDFRIVENGPVRS